MKKLIMFLLSIFIVIISNAQVKIEISNEGNFRVKKNIEKWLPSNVTADFKAVEYIDKFPQAITSPGEEILVERVEKILKLKLLFKKQAQTKEVFIVYNSQSKNVGYREGKLIKEESSYLVLFSIVPIFLMIILNTLYIMIDRKGKYSMSFAFIVLAVFMVMFIIFTAFNPVLILPSVSSILAAIIAIIAVLAVFASVVVVATFDDEYGNKAHKRASVIFYIAIITRIVLLFV